MVGAIAGAAAAPMLAGIAIIALPSLMEGYEACSYANPSIGSTNLSGGPCILLVIGTVVAIALRYGPAAYPLIFLPSLHDPILPALAISTAIGALLGGICCATLNMRKGLLAAILLYMASLVPFMLFATMMWATG